MGNTEFERACKKAVVDYHNSHPTTDKNGKQVRIWVDDVYIVWISKVLQNNKALCATDLMDGRYYEVTFNGDKHEAYVDVYQKKENFVIPETAM